jgi:hypothetical protein
VACEPNPKPAGLSEATEQSVSVPFAVTEQRIALVPSVFMR